MKGISRLTLAALALCIVLPAAAQAQRPAKPWLVEISGAYVIPSGDFGRLVKNGWGTGAFVGYSVNPQFVVAGNFNVGWLEGDCALCVDFTNYGYFAMVGYNGAAGVSKGDAYVLIGAGGVTFSPKEGESQTNFAMNGGVRTYFNLSPSVALAIDLMAVVAFTPADTFTGTTWFFPLGVGLAFRF
jgi:hypothetical protein